MSEKKIKKVFIDGPITAQFIGDSIAKHATKHEIGAHSIFLGQVRADEKDGAVVQSIHYEAYEDMAIEKFHEIRENTFEKYKLSCMHIYHSLGTVNAGEMSLFVFTSSPHRQAAIEACSYIVERIKKEVPVWGKEVWKNGEETWKVNS